MPSVAKKTGAHRSNGARIVRWNFRSAADVKDFWKKFQRVPARKRRSKRDEERYCLALYLLALATHRRLKYPLRIEEGERPDFMITWSSGKRTGLEVAKAPSMWMDCEDANGDGRSDWPTMIKQVAKGELRKLASFDVAERQDLLVYNDAPLSAIDRPKVLVALDHWLSQTRRSNPRLGRLSIIVSLDLLMDSGNGLEILPFIDWSNPRATPDFGERVELIGEKAVTTAIRKHKQEGRSINFTDRSGRIVKEMPDGSRYEVQVEPDGAEVVVGELGAR